METENPHADSLEEHLLTNNTDTKNWLGRVSEILDEQEPGEDIKATLIAVLKDDMRGQLKAVKLAIRHIPHDRYVEKSFQDFAIDTLDTILCDQDFEALAARLLKAHAEG